MAIAIAPNDSVRYPWQVAISCDLCDGYQDIVWYCNTCKGNLCTSCKTKHLEGDKLMRRHQIVPKSRTRRLDDDCSIHPGNNITHYCNDCKIKVCNVCSSELHEGHKTSQLSDVIDQSVKEVSEYINTLKASSVPNWRDLRSKVQKSVQEYKDGLDKITEGISGRREVLMSEVDQHCNKLLNQVSEKTNADMIKMQDGEKSAVEKEEEITSLLSYSEDLLKTRDSAIITFNDKKPATESLSTPDVALPSLPKFVAGDVSTYTLNDMVGYIDDSSDTEENVPIAPFSLDAHIKLNRGVSFDADGIVTIDSNIAWVHDKKDIFLVNHVAEIITSFKADFEINCMAMDNSGSILLTDYRGQMIRKMSEKGDIVDFIRTTPYCPSGICVTDSSEIVVCANTRGKPHKLAVYKADGKKLNRIIQYSDKETVGFLQKVVQNKNGDLCIAHWNLNTVFVLGRNGKIKFEYDGTDSGKSKRSFSPRDISCDQRGNLFIADYQNYSVDILDQKGNFLGFLKTDVDLDCIIYRIAFDKDGKLWIAGTCNSKLIIVEFR